MIIGPSSIPWMGPSLAACTRPSGRRHKTSSKTINWNHLAHILINRKYDSQSPVMYYRTTHRQQFVTEGSFYGFLLVLLILPLFGIVHINYDVFVFLAQAFHTWIWAFYLISCWKVKLSPLPQVLCSSFLQGPLCTWLHWSCLQLWPVSLSLPLRCPSAWCGPHHASLCDCWWAVLCRPNWWNVTEMSVRFSYLCKALLERPLGCWSHPWSRSFLYGY